LKPLPSSYPRQYLRQEIIDHGIVSEGSLKRTSNGCLGYKMEHEFPVTFDIPVLCPDSEEDDSNNIGKRTLFPVMFFSHGLFGCREMYSHFARNIASHGVVVVVIEHEDGSACYCKTVEGVDKFYKHPPEGLKYANRQDVRDFRGPMLSKRVMELSAVIAYFDKQAAAAATNNCNNSGDDSKIPGKVMVPPLPPSRGGADDFDEVCDRLFADIVRVSKLDELHFAGHSFGGASMVRILFYVPLPSCSFL
jgi:hypothetical protein